MSFFSCFKRSTKGVKEDEIPPALNVAKTEVKPTQQLATNVVGILSVNSVNGDDSRLDDARRTLSRLCHSQACW